MDMRDLPADFVAFPIRCNTQEVTLRVKRSLVVAYYPIDHHITALIVSGVPEKFSVLVDVHRVDAIMKLP